MNSIAPIRTAAPPPTRRRIDVKAIMTSHLQPYAIARRFEEKLQLAKEYGTKYGRDANGQLYALREDWRETAIEAHLFAEDIRAALPTHAEIKAAYADLLATLQASFDEANGRLLLGLMLDGFRAKPGETAPVYLDALAFSLEEFQLPNRDDDLSVPVAAIANAVRTAWATQTFPPSVHEFLGLVETSWRTLFRDLGRIRELGEFSAAVSEVIAHDEALPKPAPQAGGTGDDDIPF
jgi:hypothetical protein